MALFVCVYNDGFICMCVCVKRCVVVIGEVRRGGFCGGDEGVVVGRRGVIYKTYTAQLAAISMSGPK